MPSPKDSYSTKITVDIGDLLTSPILLAVRHVGVDAVRALLRQMVETEVVWETFRALARDADTLGDQYIAEGATMAAMKPPPKEPV